MAKEIDNSLERFTRPGSEVSYYALGAAAVLLAMAVLIAAVVVRNWFVVGVALIAGIAVVGFVVVSARRQRKLVADKAAGWIAWEPASPDVQRQSLKVAVGEISRILKVGPDAAGDLESAFIVGEDLALREVQREENVPVMRHVSLAGVPFDGVFTKGDLLVCVEVCFLVSPDLGQDRVAAMMRKIAAVKRSVAEMNIGMGVRLMVVLVTQMPAADVETLRGTLSTRRFTSTPVDIDIRLMDFEALQSLYVTEQ